MADNAWSGRSPGGNTSDDSPGKAAPGFVAPQLTVPKGGGAIRGIGEKFACNPATGTGSMTVPITTTAGRGGFGPQLAITYDSGSGNGPFGLGWTLPNPSITRKTDKGLPRYRDTEESDVFVLSGAEDLVPTRDESGIRHRDEKTVPGFVIHRYRPRIEGLFSRIERWTHLATGEIHWRSISRDNVTSIYGRDDNSRVVDRADAMPEHQVPVPRIFCWLICASFDDKGNAIVYEYAAENEVNLDRRQTNELDRRRTANRYLKRIRYGNREPLRDLHGALEEFEALRTVKWIFEAVFDYGEGHLEEEGPEEPGEPGSVFAYAQCATPAVPGWPVRRDPFSSYRAGFEVRTYRLCRRVLMFHHLPEELGAEDYLVRTTEFSYVEDGVASYLRDITHAGYLRQPKEGREDRYLKQTLPPLTCEYSRVPTAEELARQPVHEIDDGGLENLPSGVDGAGYAWVDLDAEGSSGILTEQGEGWYYKRNLSANNQRCDDGLERTRPRFGATELVAGKPTGLLVEGAQFLDLNGDGRQSLVQTAGSLRGFYRRSDECEWMPFRPFASWPNVDTSDPNLRFIDLTGHGRPDILVTEREVLTWYPSMAEAGFGPAEHARPPSEKENGARLVFEDGTESIYLADLAGDGLSDLVRIRNGEVCYWPNLGYGRFGHKITMDCSPRFDLPEQFNQRGIVLADTDGSGNIDILYRGSEGLMLYRNESGNRWSEPIPIRQFPARDPLATVNAVDLLGNGTVCIVWSSPLPGFAQAPMRYVALMEEKPHLLIRARNNLGAETKIHYRPSTKFYLDDERDGRPWITRLPFPVQVVDHVETFDYISRSRFASSYTYHHGYFDSVEREFRGFGMVEQRDTESFEEYAAGVQRFGGEQDLTRELYQPPVTTRTWFHLGAFHERERLTRQYTEQYYKGRQHLSGPIFPPGLDPRDYMECMRALKGQTLRQEIYSFDGSAQQEHPYQVVESTYEVRLLQPRGEHEHAVTFPLPRESASFQYERNPEDPRVAQSLSLEVDEYGNVLQSCSVVYGRRREDHSLPPEVRRDQGRLYITVSEKKFLPVIDRLYPAAYRLAVPFEAQSYEVSGLAPEAEFFRLEQLRAGIAAAEPIPYEAHASYAKAEKRPLSDNRVLFLDNHLKPLPLGMWDTLGLVYQSYQLTFTASVVSVHYGDKVTDADLLAAYYVHFDGDADWWMPSGVTVYGDDPAARFYLPFGGRDASGLETRVVLDRYYLLPVEVEIRQIAWNRMSAVNDYRVLGPVIVTDPNGNRTAVALDALGMVVRSAVMGKVGSSDGDTLDDPTVRAEYSLFEWMRHGRPNFVHSFAREIHGPTNTRWQESYGYSNGSGAVVMLKVQAHPGKALRLDANGRLEEVDADPRWVGNGRAVFNNKGNPVKQYEPYFSTTFAYEGEKAFGELGVTPIFFYDALGRNIRTDLPNGTLTRAEFDPWMQRSFDPNDTVKESPWYRELGEPDAARESDPPSDPEVRAAWLAARHADTPQVSHFDSLGRKVYTVSDYGGGKTSHVRSETDLTGRYSRVFDQLNREVAGGFVGMAGTPIVSRSAERGSRWTFPTALGDLDKSWDEHGRAFRVEYDVLHRPVSTFVRDTHQPEIIFSYSVYGDRRPDAVEHNLLGVAYLTFDQAGLMRVAELDFKNTPTRVETVLAKDYKNAIDWSALAGAEDLAALEAIADQALDAEEVFVVESEYDALDRPTRVVLPDHSVFVPRYNEANQLESLRTQIRGDGEFVEFVKGQDFDARGQRQFTHLGNDVLSRFFYEPKSFRLQHLLTQRHAEGSDEPDQGAIQDLRYTYDPVGNMVQLRDHAQQTRFFSNAVVRPGHLYEYSAMYQLTRATGREHSNRTNNEERTHSQLEYVPQLPHENDESSLRTYTEEYDYDLLGNLQALHHRFHSRAGLGGGWTQHLRYRYQDDPGDRTNRLSSSSLPGDRPGEPHHATYDYDAYGNMVRMPHLKKMSWNFMDHLRQVQLGGGGTAYYVYDSGGQRMRKVVERPGGSRIERIYLGSVEIYRMRRGDGTILLERSTLHVSDSGVRIAQVDTKTIDNDDRDPSNPLQVPLIRFQHSNHLGSTTLETDPEGNVISYEEYHPFGTSAFRSFKSAFEFSLKRYRFSGKELDDETGFYYFGARYYAPWLARWISADPSGYSDGLNLYLYCRDNPIGVQDVSGLEGTRIYQLGPGLTADVQTNTPEAKARLEGALTGRQVEENGVLYQIDKPVLEWRGGNVGWFFAASKSSIHQVEAEDSTVNFEPDVIEGHRPDGPPPDEPPSTPPADSGSNGSSPDNQGTGSGGGGSDEEGRSFFTSSFFKGLAVGIVVTLAVVAVVATGGAALAVIAPAAAEAIAVSGIGTALAVGGGVLTAANTVQSIRQRDLWNNPISEDQANFNLGYGVGSLVGGAAAKPFAGAGTAVGKGLGTEVTGFAGKAAAGLSEFGDFGELALATGGSSGNAVVATPAVGGVAAGSVVPIAGSAMGGSILLKTGHKADWELRQSNGRIKTRGNEVSGSRVRPGRRLNWDEQLETHTERKILGDLEGDVQPGDIITIRGTKDPCDPGGRGCASAMRAFATKYGVNITYTNTTTGQSWNYP